MKITPIANGGTPGTNIGAVSTERTSPDRIAAAKAIAAGEAPIRVSQSDIPVDPQVARAQQSIRKIKMNTNASPERFNEVLEQQVQQNQEQADPNSAISNDTEQTNATNEETKPLSPQFAALAKQRRALQVKERELQAREEALKSRPSMNDGQEIVARLKAQPLSVLQEHGVTYEQLTEAILANQGGVNPEIQALKAEIKALKEGVDKNFIDRDTAAETQALAEMRKEAVVLAQEGDAFDMIRETNSLPDVMELIRRTYKTTGEVLDVQEAMTLVENDLLNESLKIARYKKVQSKLSPAQEQSGVQNPQQQQRPQGMRTLTNRDSATVPMSRKERALAAFRGTLKK